MKIIIGTDNYFPNVNGASIFSQRLAHYLQKRGHEILVIAPGRQLLTKNALINGINVFGLGSVPILVYKDFRWTPSFVGRYDITKVVKEFKPDIIHVQDHFYIGASLVKIAKRFGIPAVGTNHFMPENLTHYLHLPETGEKVVTNMGWRYFCSVYGLLDIVTTPTKTAAKLLDNVGLNKPVITVSCGIDREKFKPTTSGDPLREKYHLPRVPTLLYVGRLDKEKKIDYLLEAFADAVKKVSGHFIVAGKGAEANNLKELVNKLELAQKVTFTGFVPEADLPGLYRTADCFIISGIAELQSIVTMEAMASGLPVIAVNAMALPELCHHEINGYLFELNDTNRLSQYMQNILSDSALQQKMSQSSLEIIEKHDINNTINQYENIYASLRPRP
ncbi:MAG: glycosyltransferase [bacterium]|nr:glycosyltransferase [bacterium]